MQQPSKNAPTRKSEPRYPKLSAEEKRAALLELKDMETKGQLRPASSSEESVETAPDPSLCFEETALERRRKRGIRLSAGLDPADLADLSIIGAAKIRRGAKTLEAWSREMVADLGESVRPHLDVIWQASQKQEPGAASPSAVPPGAKAFFAALWTELSAAIGLRGPQPLGSPSEIPSALKGTAVVQPSPVTQERFKGQTPDRYAPMNLKQRTAICVGVILVVVLGVYPPWNQTLSARDAGLSVNIVRPGRYAWLWSPPEPSGQYWGVGLDLGRLLVGWVTVILTTGGLVFALRSKSSENRSVLISSAFRNPFLWTIIAVVTLMVISARLGTALKDIALATAICVVLAVGLWLTYRS